jgi:hypothetical protein
VNVVCTSGAHAPFEHAVTAYVYVTAALPVFAGSVSVGACAADQPVVAFLRQLHDVTAPPPEQLADIEIGPPAVATEPLVGVRVTVQPEGGVAATEPCHTTATEAEPV